MQKFTKFALSLMMVLAATVAKADVVNVYSWESPEGNVIELGGTIEYVNGENLADETKPSRLNYKNGDYYTICLNGKKANLADETPSANAGHMVIYFVDELKAGDEIVMTAFYNKGEDKNVSAWLVFENGTALGSARVTSDIARGGSPEDITVVVPEEAAGSKTLTLTRNDAGTNMFITKLVVKGEREAVVPQMGEPVFNVDNDEVSGKFDMNELLVNGLYISFPDAVNVSPDMTIKVVADLYTTVPGYGVGSEGDNHSAPNFQAVLEDIEFTGDAMFGTPVVYFTEFMQYIYEAGPAAYAINVKSIKAVDELGTELYSWEADEESPVFAAVFEVIETFSTEEVTAEVNLTEANQYGDQMFTVTLSVEAEVFAGLGIAKAYCPEGIVFEPNTADEPNFTFMPAELNGIELAEEENIVFHCTDYMTAITTDEEYEGALRTQGTYAASSIIVLTDADDNEIGTAEFHGALELVASATGIKNVNFNVKDVKFNLAGQRINNANGIVIMNGKKVVLK